MEAVKQVNFTQAIIYMKILDNGSLVVVDENTAVRFLEIEKLQTISGFKANITHKRYSSNVVCFSSDAKYFVSCSGDAKEAKLYNVKTKKALAKSDRHQGEISCIGIDPKNRYMFSGGDDGKTFAIDIKSGKLAFTLPNHIDTINDIAFSSNSQWIATASYDRKISLFNLAMMTHKFRLKGQSSPVMKLQFLSDFRLLSIDKKNKAIVWNIQSSKVLARLDGIHDDVMQITKSSSDKFLFIGTKLGYILVYELVDYKLIAGRYIKLKNSITSLCFSDIDESLIIGTKNGDLLIYNIFAGEEYIVELLKNKQYSKIEEQIEVNPLLVYTKPYQLLEVLWKKTVSKAKKLLGNNEKNKALSLFNDFKNIPSKNQLIQKLMKEYLEFDKFVLLVKQNKLALAYGLTSRYPAYKDSELYESLELNWKKSFAKAQKYLLEANSNDKIQAILAPYRGIPDKTKLTHELINNVKIYTRFRVVISQKDFKMAFNLIEKNPFLMETTEYTIITNYADKIYIRLHELMQGDNTHLAIKLLNILKDFPDYEEEVSELLADAEIRQKFFDAVEENDLSEAYNILSVSEYLQGTEDGIKLNSLWDDDVEIANAYAAKGDITGISTALKQYIQIDSKRMSLATIFSWSYITQLESALKRKESMSTIEKGIKNYLLYFGYQEQIRCFYDIFKKHYPNTKIDLEHQKKGSLAMWKPIMIVKSILD